MANSQSEISGGGLLPSYLFSGALINLVINGRWICPHYLGFAMCSHRHAGVTRVDSCDVVSRQKISPAISRDGAVRRDALSTRHQNSRGRCVSPLVSNEDTLSFEDTRFRVVMPLNLQRQF